METNLKEYPIYRKRDGQGFNYVGYIYAETFEDAKKEFAQNMTKDNWEKSNNIVWLTESEDGVEQTGWYDLDASALVSFEDVNEGIDYKNSKLELFCSEDLINEGFDFWREDVYTWELREPIEDEQNDL